MVAVLAYTDLEAKIDYAALRLRTAKTEEGRRVAWQELQALHKLRSPERVRQMERAQGLSR